MEYPKEDTGGAPYCEGIVLSAKLAMEGHSSNVEETKAACDRNDDCLGLKLNTHNRKWYPLHAVQPGGGSGEVWAANSGNRAQISVLVKNCDDALVLPTSSCGATDMLKDGLTMLAFPILVSAVCRRQKIDATKMLLAWACGCNNLVQHGTISCRTTSPLRITASFGDITRVLILGLIPILHQ